MTAGAKPQSELGRIGRDISQKHSEVLDLFIEGIRAASENLAYTQGSTETRDDSRITVDMNENERADILEHTSISAVYEPQSESIDPLEYKDKRKSEIDKALINKLRSLGFLTNYKSNSIDVDFIFTGRGANKSLHSQMKYGGDYGDFVNAVNNIKVLLNNAVLIETHSDKAVGTDKENPRLKQVYVMLSLLQDGEHVIPVQFEVKEYKNSDNRLYLTVALSKIETSVLAHTASEESLTDKAGANLYYNYSIADVFRNINTIDYQFLKYIPDRFLNNEQLNAKERALKEQDEKYATKFQSRGADYLSAVERGDIRYDSRDMGDWFDDDDAFLSEDGEIQDVFARHYLTHSEAIGEVLKNTADIEIAPGTVKNIVSRVLREQR